MIQLICGARFYAAVLRVEGMIFLSAFILPLLVKLTFKGLRKTPPSLFTNEQGL